MARTRRMPEPERDHRKTARYWGKATIESLAQALDRARYERDMAPFLAAHPEFAHEFDPTIADFYEKSVVANARRAAHWAALALDCPDRWTR